MRRPDLTDAGIAAVAAAVAVLTTDRSEPGYVLTLVFATVLVALLGLVLRHAVTTFRLAYAEQRRARSLADLDPAVAARRAVLEERARLSAELDSCVRAALATIQQELVGMDGTDDGGERARRIHLRAREATSELRRQLGLLRGSEARQQPVTQTKLSTRLTRRTMVFAAVVAVAAGLENWMYYAIADHVPPAFVPVWSLPLTVLAAATVVGWRVAPVTAAAVLAALLVVPRLAVGAMVSSGGWLVVTLACLTWGLALHGLRDVRALVAAVVMTGAVVGSRLYDDPENALICAVLIAVAWVLGFAVGWNRRRREAAEQRAALLQANLDAASEQAVQGERLAVARDVHDVVSHAVGVVAIQAAAAEVSWPANPETALQALETIDRVVGEALAELDRVVPGEARPVPRHDLTALVERIRSTGTDVRLTVRGVPAEDVDPIVYRIAQEGLTNAVRHAPSAAVDVHVEAVGDRFRVRVSDDGAGPIEENTRGFGLVGLAERVSLSGGTLRTGRGPNGHGFTVEATVPVRHDEVV